MQNQGSPGRKPAGTFNIQPELQCDWFKLKHIHGLNWIHLELYQSKQLFCLLKLQNDSCTIYEYLLTKILLFLAFIKRVTILLQKDNDDILLKFLFMKNVGGGGLFAT